MKPDVYRPNFEWTTSPLRNGKIAMPASVVACARGESNLVTEIPLFHLKDGIQGEKFERLVIHPITSAEGHGGETIHINCQTLDYKILPAIDNDEYVTCTRTSYGPSVTRYIDGHQFMPNAPQLQANVRFLFIQDKKQSRAPVILKTLEIIDPRNDTESSGICVYQALTDVGHKRKELLKKLCARAESNAFDISWNSMTSSKSHIIKGTPNIGKGYDRHHYDDPEHISVPTMIESALLLDFGRRAGFIQKARL